MRDNVVRLKVSAEPGPAAGRADGASFREAMARLAGGVGVAACWSADGPCGLLVSSITSLSADPPRVLFCVRKAAASHDDFLASPWCSVNILGERDRAEAELFSDGARRGERFSGGAWRLDDPRAPLRPGALAALLGRVSHRMDAGSHSLFVLEIETASAADDRPLVYFNRAFSGLLPLEG